MSAIAKPAARLPERHKSDRGFKLWDGLGTVLLNALAWALVFAYLFPMVYMVATAIKSDVQFQQRAAPPWPARQLTTFYDGKDRVHYTVPTVDGPRVLALVNARRAYSEFIDPNNPNGGLIRWEGYWGSLEPVYEVHITLDQFTTLWGESDFMRYVRNTLFVAALAGGGAVIASILVAYGFARFPIPGGRWLFLILIATIMLPDKVTLMPTYFVFTRVLHWTGSFLPLIVPHLFGNAIMIFLLRQNFKSIPKDIEEAAVLDGCGPIRLLVSIILPQAVPVIITVALFQFFFFWNETRQAALYISTSPRDFPVSYWMQQRGILGFELNRLQASALMVMVVPVFVLFLSQRFFMRGVIVTGTEK
jgi:multiple sugar transport system permease protein